MENHTALIKTEKIVLFRETNIYPKNPDMVLFEIYIRYENDEDSDFWDKVMKELGFEFMDRDDWGAFGAWENNDGFESDKYFLFVNDNGIYE